MKVRIEIDEKYIEPNAVIYTNKVTDEISKIVEFMKEDKTNVINGFKNEQVFIVKIDEIEKIYALNGKVFLETKNETLEVKKRMYELEEILPQKNFFRISNSEIINFDKVKNIELKIYGTLIIHFYSEKVAYASRRYIKKIKDFLGL